MTFYSSFPAFIEELVFDVPRPGSTETFFERFVTLNAEVPVSFGFCPYFFTRDSILLIAFAALSFIAYLVASWIYSCLFKCFLFAVTKSRCGCLILSNSLSIIEFGTLS